MVLRIKVLNNTQIEDSVIKSLISLSLPCYVHFLNILVVLKYFLTVKYLELYLQNTEETM